MLKQLRDQLGQKRERAKQLFDLCAAESRNLTDVENTESETILTEIEKLETQVRTQERLQAASLAGATIVGTGTQGEVSANDRKDVAKFSFLRAINTFGTPDFDGIQKEMHEEGTKQLRMINQVPSGIAIPEMVTRAGQSVGVAADGGN